MMIFKLFKKDLGQMYFFVHIPKTAGTSFRKGLDKIAKVANHYKQGKKDTSNLVEEEIYVKNDKYAFAERFFKEKYQWISGHVAISGYQELVDPRCIIAFLREPVARTYSLFGHHVTYNDYQNDFETFLNEARYQNNQSKFIKGFPLELIGVVGLTEKYNESIALVNNALNVKIPRLIKNVNKKHKKMELSNPLIEKLYLLNQVDHENYLKAVWLFEKRFEFKENRIPWCHAISNIDKNEIFGVAWYAESDVAVELELVVDGEVTALSIAKDMYLGTLKTKFPRLGFVAYSFSKDHWFNAENQIDIRVSATQQVINFTNLKTL